MIGVITNLNAGGLLADPGLHRRLVALGGRRACVLGTRDADQVRRAVERLAEQQVPLVALCGGDGSVSWGLTEMLRVWGPEALPRVALLRGGTTNTLANNLGQKGRPEQLLTRLLACRSQGRREPAQSWPTLLVNGRCGFIFSAALGARFFERYYRDRRVGYRAAALLAARIAVSSLLGSGLSRQVFQPLTARVTADGEELPERSWRLLAAATVLDLGLGIRLTYRARERPGLFHLVASAQSPASLARQFHRTFLARPLRGARHFDLLAREARVELQQEEPYVLDGDLFRARRVQLRSGPQVQVSVI
jgi:diacylglycerol kinase family enzyme